MRAFTNANRRLVFEFLAYAALASGCRDDSAATPITPVGPGAAVDTQSGADGVRTETPRAPSGRTRPSPAGMLPALVMVGREAGLAFERNDDIRGLRRIVEANGGGVAVFDFDGDGWLDLYFTNGCRLPLALDEGESSGALFRNRAGARFEAVTGPSRLVHSGYATGCAVGDYDADGFDDLYVTAFGPVGLWHNNGDGTFTESAAGAGAFLSKWSTSAAFYDVNGDGHLDLYVVNYLAESDETPMLCPNSASPDGYEQCPPAKFEGVDDVLFLSDGAGRFVDATAASGLDGLRGKGLGVVISDFDFDGFPEIFVANDGEPNFLFTRRDEARGRAGENEVGGAPAFTFRESALSRGVALCEAGYAQANMGIAAGDYNADGTLDLFVTTFFGDTDTLYANRGGLVFEDATRAARLGSPTRNKLGFGTVFVDLDNDGWLDLFIANGHVDDRTWMPHGDPYRMRPQVLRNERDGSFTDVSDWSGDYFLEEWLGRGVAAGDLDRDGLIDVVISHQLAPSLALRNETSTDNAALVVRLVGTNSNRNGYGARIEIVARGNRTVREIIGGGSFQSASSLELHLGLDRESRATLDVHWPSGLTERFADVAAGRLTLIEGTGTTPQAR